MPRTRIHTAEVLLNGEFYCSVSGDKDIIVLAQHHADKLKERQARIARSLKIRDMIRIEVRVQ